MKDAVTITNISNSPSIYSVGTLAWNSAALGGPQPMFAAVGVQSPSASTGTSRAVLVQTAPPKSYFLFGILAKKGISITGGGTNDSVSSLDPNYAANCTFYGSSKCTSIIYSGSSSFIGTVWAPYAAYTQSGGSGVIGAMIVYSFTQSGGKSLFRYDETLGLGAASGVYRVVSWQEVPVNQ